MRIEQVKPGPNPMMKHTPGPWLFSDAIGAQNLGVYPAFPEDHQLRGTICGNGIAMVSADDKGRANARLIAAAPELLQALQATADRLFVAYPDTDGDDCCPHCEADATFNGLRLRLSQVGHESSCRWLEARTQVAKARRIIAKAEGIMQG